MVVATVAATVAAIVIGNGHRIWNYNLLKCVRLYASTSMQSPRHMSGRKVGERSTKPPGFTMPH
jgi:hypothetical protein